MAELHDLTGLEQGAAIRAGEVSSGELVEHYLARIDGEPYGAFVTVTADQARERARSTRPAAGPLSGVPTAVKDLNATAGVRTTFGSAAYDDFVRSTPAQEKVFKVFQESDGRQQVSLDSLRATLPSAT